MNLRIKYIIVFIILVTLVVLSLKVQVIRAQNTSTVNLKLIKSKQIQELLKDSLPDKRIKSILKDYNAQLSQWQNIDYNDNSRNSWQPRVHIFNIRALAIEAKSNKSLNEKEIISYSQIINDGLETWFQNNYQCPNWFVNDVGINQLLVDILFLTEDKLSSQNKTNIFKKLEGIDKVIEIKEGANRVLLSTIKLKYGIFKEDEKIVDKSIDYINGEIFISKNNENIQNDYSYHYHKARIQMYTYGSAFLESCVNAASLVENTKWALKEDKISILRNFILEGWQWLARGKYSVPSTIDRTSSSKGALELPYIVPLLEKMKIIDTAFATQYQSIINQQNDITLFNLEGTKNFPYSDIAVAHSPNASFFIKVLSDRNLPTQSINSENLKGKFLHFGNHFIIQDGQEYTDLAGAWDWNLLPGFSYVQNVESITQYSNTGIADFDNTIVASMPFTFLDKNGKQLFKLKKLWVLQKDKLICMISAPDKQLSYPIITALDQSKFRGNVFIKNENISASNYSRTLKNGDWLYHNHLIYYSPQANAVTLQTKVVKNDWESINSKYKKDKNELLTNIYLPIIQQNNNSISYSILYSKIFDAIENTIAQNQYSEVVNNQDFQVCYLKKEDSYCGVIYSPNSILKLNSRKIKIKTMQPIQFVLKKNIIFVSEPSLKTSELSVVINSKTYKIKLDKNGQGKQEL